MLIRNHIAELIRTALQKAQKSGAMPDFELSADIPLSKPKAGDYASPVAMGLARFAKMAPVAIAEQIVRHLPQAEFLGQVKVSHPGFLEFYLDPGWVARQVEAMLAGGTNYGTIDLGGGKKVQVEFVSANPTGPLHVGSARNAAYGDSLANVLANAGYQVQREYYVNDAGTQMETFNRTLFARYRQQFGQPVEIPPDGYAGEYMIDLAREIVAAEGDRYLHMPEAEALAQLGELGLAKVLDWIRSDLTRMGIHFDRWFSERSLYTGNAFQQIMRILREGGWLVEREGAVWFTAHDPKIKDEVIIRSNGVPGYFASDIAYHYDKFVTRGFDWVIDVWGADHQGHVPRMKAMMRALGLDPDRLTLVIYQNVTLLRGGVEVRMSKRTGEIITLKEVLDEVGPDAVRFMLLQRAIDTHMEFDLEVAQKQTEENPVFYVQYAHARIASIQRYAIEKGVDPTGGDVSLLTHPAEQALIREMLRLPEVIELAATQLAPHHLTHYAISLADAFHSFYTQCRVVSSAPGDEAINKARLKLVTAAKQVLARTLGLLGVSAPESM